MNKLCAYETSWISWSLCWRIWTALRFVATAVSTRLWNLSWPVQRARCRSSRAAWRACSAGMGRLRPLTGPRRWTGPAAASGGHARAPSLVWCRQILARRTRSRQLPTSRRTNSRTAARDPRPNYDSPFCASVTHATPVSVVVPRHALATISN